MGWLGITKCQNGLIRSGPILKRNDWAGYEIKVGFRLRPSNTRRRPSDRAWIDLGTLELWQPIDKQGWFTDR